MSLQPDVSVDRVRRALTATVQNNYDDPTVTVRDYLRQLLSTLWLEKETFSGKRPFGDSGWECDVYAALVNDGLIDGHLDEYGYVDGVDEDAGDALIAAAIELVFTENSSL